MMFACVTQDGTPADDGFNAVAMGLDGSSVWAGKVSLGTFSFSFTLAAYTGRMLEVCSDQEWGVFKVG